MNKSMLAGIGIGVAAALGVAAVASLNVFERGPQYAQVVSATPIKESVKTPRQECRNVTVTHRKPVQDENRIAGSVLGAETVKTLSEAGCVVINTPLDNYHFPASVCSVIAPLVVLQRFYLFVARLSQARGLDPDRPLFLNKVTQTR